jgi:hypothetical protein
MQDNNPFGYYIKLVFEAGEPVAAMFKDDYDAWLDIEAGIMGSNLSDANVEMPRSEFDEMIVYYVDQMKDYFNTVQTNDVMSCLKYFQKVGITTWSIVMEGGLDKRSIQALAKEWYDKDVAEFPDVDRSPGAAR